MAVHDGAALSVMLEHAQIYQVAQVLGVWNWNLLPTNTEIFGGIIVQTDPNAPTRER